jgi:hypothetical protein
VSLSKFIDFVLKRELQDRQQKCWHIQHVSADAMAMSTAVAAGVAE